MADSHQEENRHRGAGYATVGYPAGEGFVGDLPQRYYPASAVLRGGERAHQHPPAAGGGHCGGKGQGRKVRPAAQAAAGELPQRLPAVEGRSDHRHGGGERVRDAAVHLPLPGGNLRKSQVVVKGVILQECVLSCKREFL